MIFFFKQKKIFLLHLNENKHVRYHLILQYGWFLQNLGKCFFSTNMHTVYCVLSEKDQILKKLSRDQGPRNQTLYSPLNVLRLLTNTRQESGIKKLKWQDLDSLLYMTIIPSSLTLTMKENHSLDTGLLSAK